MKSIFYFIGIFLSIFITFSCSSDKEINYQEELKISKALWESFKKSNDNSYKYTVTRASWTGETWETTITVKGGVVSGRQFKYTSPDSSIDYVPQEDREWTENFNELGSHSNSSAADPITLDEIYLKAEKDWLINRKNTTSYLRTENNGIISYCGYVENDCEDDCFIGIIIENISPL